MNNDLSDLATAMTGSVAADGQTVISGSLKGANGSLATPGYSFAADLNTGMYRVTTDTVALVGGGVAILTAGPTGVAVTGLLSATGNGSIGGALTVTGKITSSAGFADTLLATSTDAGAGVGPVLDLFRDSASPAASDLIGAIIFNGRDSVATKTTYAQISAQINDPVDGTEDGTLSAQRVVAGALTTIWQSTATGMSVTGVLAVTGNLTVGGTITPSTPGFTQQFLLSGTAATYTTPAGVRTIKVRMIAGGGGGGGSTGNGGTGGTTTFNSVTVIGGGGGGGVGGASSNGGTGGTGGTGTAQRWVGSGGGTGDGATSVSGAGGAGPFGGNGRGKEIVSTAGDAGGANSGAGGGGGISSGGGAGGGGGSGEYAEIIIQSPAATYTYTIGTAGAAGTGAFLGGAGGTGVIVVEEYY